MLFSILVTAVSMLAHQARAINWQSGSNGQVMWGMNCDFYGNDIARQPSSGEECGGICAAYSGCDHFTWNGGYCYLKKANNPPVSDSNGAVCGWVTGGGGGGVQLAVVNNCPFPTWLANTPNTGFPALPGGTVQLASGQRYVYQISNSGWAGRFWPKTGCDQSGTNCQFGDSAPPCPARGCQPPADTKIEFNFPPQPPKTDSWYDISLVDGYSLPIQIVPRGVNQGSCVSTKCALNLASCPSNEISGIGDLRVWNNGKVVACLSPCKKWNYPSPYGMGRPEQNAPGVDFCCPTPPISSQACRNGPVIQTNFVKLVRSSCPTAYSFAYDDEGGLHSCPGQTSFDVTICP